MGGANCTSVPGASKGTSVSDRAIQILGSLAGFGALTYGVGCAILWLRYQTTGFNADEALSVAPRGQIIFLGFRWIMGWALFVAALTALLVWVRAHALKVPGAKFLNAWIIVAAESILVVVAFLFSTWSALTLAIDLLAITVFISWDELRGRRANRSQQPGESSASTVRTWRVGRTAIFVALIATFSAIGWQLEIKPSPYVAVENTGSSASRRTTTESTSENGRQLLYRPTARPDRGVLPRHLGVPGCHRSEPHDPPRNTHPVHPCKPTAYCIRQLHLPSLGRGRTAPAANRAAKPVIRIHVGSSSEEAPRGLSPLP